MSKNPVNLLLRFLMEVAALGVYGYWGYYQSDSWTRIPLAIILPLLFAVIWGVFAVPSDPSRSGKTVVPTPGAIRLVIELTLFGAASWMLFDLGIPKFPLIAIGVVVLHYILSFDRVRWLMKQK